MYGELVVSCGRFDLDEDVNSFTHHGFYIIAADETMKKTK